MENKVFGTFVIIASFIFISLTEPSTDLNIISFNIRYDNPNDGQHRWDNRKQRVVNLLKFYQADIFGLQEALHHQVTYVEEYFPEFRRIGVGRDDGETKGEYSPIYYHSGKLESIDAGTFWLSETPDQPSKSWDAALPRIATWALLRTVDSKDTLLACNTHFDHRGEVARWESAKLLREKLPTLAKNIPIILMGDFNSTPDSDPYRTLREVLSDARDESNIAPVGPAFSFSGFQVTPDLPGGLIDHVFVSPSVKVERYAIISEEFEGSYPSDHFPVFVEISL